MFVTAVAKMLTFASAKTPFQSALKRLEMPPPHCSVILMVMNTRRHIDSIPRTERICKSKVETDIRNDREVTPSLV